MKADLSLYDYHVAACIFCEVSDALHLANENGTGGRRRNHCEIGLGESVQRGLGENYKNDRTTSRKAQVLKLIKSRP